MEIPVIVERVVYRNENGFAILSVSLNAFSSEYNNELEDLIKGNCKGSGKVYLGKTGSETFTVSLGMLASAEVPEGQQYILAGDFTTHPKYGNQFKADFYYKDAPKTFDGLQAYLETLPNIGESRSKAILSKFGVEETVRILEEDIERLLVINGITEKRLDAIQEAWINDRSLRDLYLWLSKHNISPALGQKIYDRWHGSSIVVLEENPYKLVEIWGIGFVMADAIAHKILDEIPAIYRTIACMKFVLSEDVKNGNLCTPYDSLKKRIVELITKCNSELRKTENMGEYVKLFSKCIKDNLDEFSAVKRIEDINGNTFVYLKNIWEKEKFVAQELYKKQALSKEKEVCTDEDIVDAEKDISMFCDREVLLDDKQKEAIKSAFNNNVTVIAGGGGTGKTTICRCIFYLAQKKRLSIRMMSPTGKAAQVLSDKTGCEAETIHRSLKMTPGEDTPRESVSEDILILDETSMIGVDTMSAVMSALEANKWCRIVFVGDSNQLPSVSPGNFLSDIIAARCANVIRLDKIHRQDENSYISLLANEISNGKVVDIPSNATDIRWRNLDSDTFENDLINMLENYLKKGYDLDDLQIISPMKKGVCGVYKINEVIQKMMVERNGFEYIDQQKYYIGDRVIQTQNNYEKMIFNGDMGSIVDMGERAQDPSKSDKKEKFITVDFYGEYVTFWSKEIDSLMLAWAITVHKFQGSQTKNVIFVMASEARIMMNKELVYTAFTRAEKFLIIVGHMTMLKVAPMHSAIRKRYTNMTYLIDELRSNRKLLQVME